MPYIVVKAYPKDTETKRVVAEEITRIFAEKWGCSREAVSLRYEEFSPADWEREVKQGEIDPNADKMTVLSGEIREPAE